MSKKKRTRLLTNRLVKDSYGINKDYYQGIEMEEIDDNQYLYLCDPDGSCPYSVDLVQEEFQKMGREYIPTGKEVAKTIEDLMIK